MGGGGKLEYGNFVVTLRRDGFGGCRFPSVQVWLSYEEV